MTQSDAAENLGAFRPDWSRKCEVCDAKPVVTATGLCGPCTWGEADTVDGAWWGLEDEARYQALKSGDRTGSQDDQRPIETNKGRQP